MNQLTTPNGDLIPLASLEDWGRRRQAALAAMQEVMGPLPGEEKRCPLEIKVEEQRDCGSYLRQLLTYTSEPHCRTPAYLLIPKSALLRDGPTPAVLCLSGTNFVQGHRSVANPDASSGPGYGAELAERGYVVIAPGYPRMASYQPGWSDWATKARA